MCIRDRCSGSLLSTIVTKDAARVRGTWEGEMDTEAVFKEVEGKAARMADLLKQLIRVDTSVPPGKNYGVLLDVVEPLLSTAGLSTKRVVVPEERWRRIPLPLE